MPIVRQYQPSMAAVGNVAYQSGVGEYAKWLAGQKQQDANRATQARLQAAQIAAQARARREQQQMQAAQSLLSMTAQRNQQLLGYTMQQQQMQQKAQLSKELWDYQFTATQRKNVADINNQIQWVMGQDTWTPDQKSQAVWQLEQQRLGVRPMPVPKAKTTDWNVEWERQAIDLGDGRYVAPNGRGGWTQFMPPKDDSGAAEQKQLEAAAKEQLKAQQKAETDRIRQQQKDIAAAIKSWREAHPGDMESPDAPAPEPLPSDIAREVQKIRLLREAAENAIKYAPTGLSGGTVEFPGAMVGTQGSVSPLPTAPVANVDPAEIQAMVQWAIQHPTDPRSQQILQRFGGGR